MVMLRLPYPVLVIVTIPVLDVPTFTLPKEYVSGETNMEGKPTKLAVTDLFPFITMGYWVQVGKVPDCSA